MEYLALDLNELATEAIKKEIAELKNTIDVLYKENNKIKLENEDAKEELKKVGNLTVISNSIREKYNSITKTKEGDWDKSITRNRYDYIKNLMSTLFKITEEHGFYEASLLRNLAINYYNNRSELVSIIGLIEKTKGIYDHGMIGSIEAFRMPVDFTKEEIMKYAQNPHHCTNGSSYGVNQYYVDGSNAPHDLYQKNKHIVSADVFEEILNTIKNKKSNYSSLYSIYKYNKLSEENIKKLGEVLMSERNLNYNEVEPFVSDNLHSFNTKTLEYLYTKITTDNHFKLFHWDNFPVKYQHKYLMNKDIKFVLDTLNHYSCKWSDKEKDKFLKMYYTKSK